MVIAALCEQLLPSARGLTRDEGYIESSSAITSSAYVVMGDDGAVGTGAVTGMRMFNKHSIRNHDSQNHDDDDDDDNNNNVNASSAIATGATSGRGVRQRRKRFRATKCLASLSADFDVVMDWIFYFHCRNADREYNRVNQQDDYDDDGQKEDSLSSSQQQQQQHLIPPVLLWTIFIVCILGTVIWLVLATDGAIASPILRRLGYDKLSMGWVLFLSVLVEDIPQVVLTCLVEDYFEEDGAFTSYALMNVLSSLYDTLIKLAEAFDERSDIVETGIWCKHSIWAHRKCVTCVIALPTATKTSTTKSTSSVVGDILPISNQKSGWKSSTSVSSRLSSQSRIHLDPRHLMQQQAINLSENDQVQQSRRRSLEEARSIVSRTELPRLRFLSSSMDGTSKLWDTQMMEEPNLRTFRGHRGGVSCMVLLGDINPPVGSPSRSNVVNLSLNETYFLTGSSDGACKLWTLSGNLIRTYRIDQNSTGFLNRHNSLSKVTSLAYLRVTGRVPHRDIFVAGYKSGKVRVWDVWSGSLVGEFKGHTVSICCMCSFEHDQLQFSTGSDDCNIKIWKIDPDSLLDVAEENNLPSNDGNYDSKSSGGFSMVPSLSLSFASWDDASKSCTDSKTIGLNDSTSSSSSKTNLNQGLSILPQQRTLVGHTGSVLSLAISSSDLLLSGSADHTVRLWSRQSGRCLRVFLGHTDAVASVAFVDDVTVMSGSNDTTIKVWDAVSASLVRTYTGHTCGVSSIAPASNGTFISAGADQTIKLWIFTSLVPPLRNSEEETLQDVLGIEGNTCNACSVGIEGREVDVWNGQVA